jgi:segregation and condensation protein A
MSDLTAAFADPAVGLSMDDPVFSPVQGKNRGQPASPPIVQLDGFEGPIDLLLELARQQRVDLGRISVLALADQFITAMTEAGRSVPLERQGEWLVIATWLVLLKSRLLLPGSPAEAELAEHDAEAEMRRLEEQLIMRAAAGWLRERPQLGQDVFGRGVPEDRQVHKAGFATLLEAGLIVFRGAQDRPEDAIYRPAPPRLWRVSDALAYVRALLPAISKGAPLAAFLPKLSEDEANPPLRMRVAIASTLMAGLELAREGMLTLHQKAPFETIIVQRRPHDPETPEGSPQFTAAIPD